MIKMSGDKTMNFNVDADSTKLSVFIRLKIALLSKKISSVFI